MKNFLITFTADDNDLELHKDLNISFQKFDQYYKGKSFNKSLYKVLNDEERNEAKLILGEISNHEIKNNINIFGRDWLGRYFAQQSPDRTLLFDVINGQVLNASGDIDFLYNVILVEDDQSLLEKEIFDEWIKESGNFIDRTHVATIIQPLFFGGTLEIDNLEVSDNKFNWEFTLGLLDNKM